jgi:hypothetical protein
MFGNPARWNQRGKGEIFSFKPPSRVSNGSRCEKNEVVARVDLAADCAHDDTARVRMLTESGIMSWRRWLVGVISSKSLTECYARNLRPETWRSLVVIRVRRIPITGKRWPNPAGSSKEAVTRRGDRDGDRDSPFKMIFDRG